MATQIDRSGLEALARRLNDLGLEVALWSTNALTQVDREALGKCATDVGRLRDRILEAGRIACSRIGR